VAQGTVISPYEIQILPGTGNPLIFARFPLVMYKFYHHQSKFFQKILFGDAQLAFEDQQIHLRQRPASGGTKTAQVQPFPLGMSHHLVKALIPAQPRQMQQNFGPQTAAGFFDSRTQIAELQGHGIGKYRSSTESAASRRR
jgi:hypothetical protein